LRDLFPQYPDPKRFDVQTTWLSAPLFSAFRRYPAEKLPLPATVPGMGPEAPDFTLVRDLIKTQTSAKPLAMPHNNRF
jgi:hypothetical protein